jgi:hypothetical protein
MRHTLKSIVEKPLAGHIGRRLGDICFLGLISVGAPTPILLGSLSRRLRHLQIPTIPPTPPGPRQAPVVEPGELLTTDRLVLQKTIIRPGEVATIVETTYFALLLVPLKSPRLSAIRTRWEIVRASIFCMTAAL